MTTFIGCRKGNKKESGDFIYDIIYYYDIFTIMKKMCQSLKKRNSFMCKNFSVK